MTYYEAWTEYAVCRQTDPDAFFPDPGGSVVQAVAVCGGCPVRLQCLDTAMRAEAGKGRHVRIGIWGGLVPNARAKYEPQWLAEQEASAA
jgi:WhiB family redox-sensing transcriptional regulator